MLAAMPCLLKRNMVLTIHGIIVLIESSHLGTIALFASGSYP